MLVNDCETVYVNRLYLAIKCFYFDTLVPLQGTANGVHVKHVNNTCDIYDPVMYWIQTSISIVLLIWMRATEIWQN